MHITKLSFGLLFLFVTTMTTAQNGNVFLDKAYWKSNPTITDIEQKMSQGNDISELNPFAFDAVSLALIEKVDNATIKYLLTKKGNNVNKLTHDGRTYIFWAAYKGNLEIMKHLVDNGAKTDIIDDHGYSLMNFAAITGQLNTDLYDFCIANGANLVKETNHDGANALLLAAPFYKDLKLIDYFVSKGITIDSVDDNGNGLFNYATKNGNIDLLKALVSKGVPFDVRTNDASNAMIFASQGTRRHVNTLEVFKYLESLGINPNVTTTKGVTPLHALAYKSKDLTLFDYFISKGVNVNQANEDGNTAFSNAAYANDLSVVKHLFKHVKDIDAANKEGKTALTNAIYRNTVDVVDFLVENNANVSIKDKEGNTLLYYALKAFKSNAPEDFNRKLDMLLKNGLDSKTTQAKGNTLFHLALDNDSLDLLKRVYDLGGDVNTKNNDGISPLHKAAMKAKDESILKYLISIGANKAMKTDFEESAYDLAKENELLKEYNINIDFLK